MRAHRPPREHQDGAGDNKRPCNLRHNHQLPAAGRPEREGVWLSQTGFSPRTRRVMNESFFRASVLTHSLDARDAARHKLSCTLDHVKLRKNLNHNAIPRHFNQKNEWERKTWKTLRPFLKDILLVVAADSTRSVDRAIACAYPSTSGRHSSSGTQTSERLFGRGWINDVHLRISC